MNQFTNAIESMENSMTSGEIKLSDDIFNKDLLSLRLAELRETVGIPQNKMDNFSQSAVSKLEKRKDIKISTLIDYIKDLGMNLQITASNKEQSFVLLNC